LESLATFHVAEGETPPANLIIVAHVGGLYYLVKPGYTPASGTVFMVPDQAVDSATLSPSPK
jgi:hypothetical protein